MFDWRLAAIGIVGVVLQLAVGGIGRFRCRIGAQENPKNFELIMENHKLVLPGHLNQYGFLFGGDLLKWVDEYAWIAATLEYPDCNFVTIGMDRVEFRKSVKEGTILKFIVEKTEAGLTSVTYLVHVYRGDQKAMNDLIFSTSVTFVRVDEDGHKTPLPSV